MIQRVDVLTQDGLRKYTEILVAWIKEKLQVKTEEYPNLKINAEGNQIQIQFLEGLEEMSHIYLPIVGDTAGLMTPTQSSLLDSLVRSGIDQGFFIQGLIDGTNINPAAMELGNIYIKDGNIYCPIQQPDGSTFNVIQIGKDGIKNINESGTFELYANANDGILVVDKDMDLNSENPLQNKVITQQLIDINNDITTIYTNIGLINTLQNDLTDISGIISGISSDLKDCSDTVKSNKNDITTIQNKLNDLNNFQQFTDLKQNLENWKGRAIEIDNEEYTFEDEILRREEYEYVQGSYLIKFNDNYYIYDAENRTRLELSSSNLTGVGKTIDLNFKGNITSTQENACPINGYLYDTDTNILYKKISDNSITAFGKKGETYILTSEGEYFLATIGSSINKIYTSLDGQFATKDEQISGVGNIIEVQYWGTEEPTDQMGREISDGNYFFNTSTKSIAYRKNQNWNYDILTKGKYLILNGCQTNPDYGNYYILDLDSKTCEKITLNAIERIYLKKSENEFEPLDPTKDLDGYNKVVIDISEITPTSETNSLNIIEPLYFQEQLPGVSNPGDYGLDSNNILYIYDETWEEIPVGNYLIKHSQEIQNENSKDILYLLNITEENNELKGTLTRLANFSEIGGANGSITEIREPNMYGGITLSNNEGVVQLPSYVKPEVLDSYYTKTYTDSNFATKSELDAVQQSRLVQVKIVNNTLNNINSNTVYSLNTLTDSDLKLVIYKSEELLLQVQRSGNYEYYRKWIRTSDILNYYNYSKTLDIYYSVDNSIISFWKWDFVQRKYISTDISGIINKIDNLTKSIQGLSIVYPSTVYNVNEIQVTNENLNKYYIVLTNGRLTRNSLYQINLNDNVPTLESVTSPCIVYYSSSLYIYSGDFIRIQTEPDLGFYILRYKANGTPTGTLNVNEMWYDQSNDKLYIAGSNYTFKEVTSSRPILLYSVQDSKFYKYQSGILSEVLASETANSIKNIIICKYWDTRTPQSGNNGDYWYNPNTYEFRVCNGGWANIDQSEINNIINENNLYISLQTNSIYRYDSSTQKLIALSSASSSSSDETITDEELNRLLKDIAEKLKQETDKLYELNIDLEKVNNINKLSGYIFGYDNVNKYEEAPSIGKKYDVISVKNKTTNNYILQECTNSVKYPILSIRCAITDNEKIGVKESGITINIVRKGTDVIESLNNVFIVGNSDELVMAETLCSQFVANGYKRLTWDNTSLLDNNKLCYYPGSVCVMQHPTNNKLYYVKVVPKNYGELVQDPTTKPYQTINYYYDNSDILIRVATTYKNGIQSSIGYPATWSNLTNSNKLIGSQFPTNNVVTGQCYFYVSNDNKTKKPCWAYVNSQVVEWYDANGTKVYPEQ